MLVDAGSPSAYLASTERCVALAREGRMLVQLGTFSDQPLRRSLSERPGARADLADESVEVSRQVGDSTLTEAALINAGFTWWLCGEWDRSSAS